MRLLHGLTGRTPPTDPSAWTGPRPVVEVDGRRIRMPGFYHRADSFQSVHLANAELLRSVLPTEDLHPVLWFDGRAAVMVWALRYHEVSGVDVTDDPEGTVRLLAPYGEVGVAALVTRAPAPAGIPLLRPTMPGVGGFVLHLPVTTAEACDLGRVVYNLPKFVADMDFEEGAGRRAVTVADEDGVVLRCEVVRPAGPVLPERDHTTLYSAQDGWLLETEVPLSGHRQLGLGRSAGRLVLGRHPVGRALAALAVAEQPLMVASHLDLALTLPPGHTVGTARRYDGHRGAARERGRFTVAFPGTGPVDQYAVSPGILHPGKPR